MQELEEELLLTKTPPQKSNESAGPDSSDGKRTIKVQTTTLVSILKVIIILILWTLLKVLLSNYNDIKDDHFEVFVSGS